MSIPFHELNYGVGILCLFFSMIWNKYPMSSITFHEPNYRMLIFILLRVNKGSLGATVKLLSYNLEVTDSSFRNNLLQCGIRLRTIDLSLGPHINGTFVHWTVLFYKSISLFRNSQVILAYFINQITCTALIVPSFPNVYTELELQIG